LTPAVACVTRENFCLNFAPVTLHKLNGFGQPQLQGFLEDGRLAALQPAPANPAIVTREACISLVLSLLAGLSLISSDLRVPVP
jgi:hypothetical protein